MTSEDAQKRIRELEGRVAFLEHQLRSDKLLHLRLYRFGAGVFLLAAVSLASWKFFGISAPLRPGFAAVTGPVGLAMMIMAFLVKRIKPLSRGVPELGGGMST